MNARINYIVAKSYNQINQINQTLTLTLMKKKQPSRHSLKIENQKPTLSFV